MSAFEGKADIASVAQSVSFTPESGHAHSTKRCNGFFCFSIWKRTTPADVTAHLNIILRWRTSYAFSGTSQFWYSPILQ
jgi:hypothetical protein